MSSRLIKFLIIFLLIFSAQLIVLQFLLLRPQLAQAALPRIETTNEADTQAKCSCSSQASSANQGVRLYIPIPWVTDGCGYVCDVNNDGKANVVDYIVSIYKFLVGLAAILAVIMIVWGGLLRIFSGGQANRISASNDTIVSAVIGLVLALVSVSLLQAINPALTNVELPSLTNIGRVSVSGIFATDDDIMLREESELVALNNQILTDQEAQSFLTQNSKLKTFTPKAFGARNHNSNLKTDLINTAKAQSVTRIDQLLGQELAYEADDAKKLKDSYQCPDGRMCFLIDKSNLDKELVLGSKLKCNSTVDVKIAHINFKEDTDPITFKKIKTNMIKSIECYHGLCDKEKNTHWDENIKAISDFITTNYQNISYDLKCSNPETDCIISSEGKDVGSAFAYGQDCSEIGSTGLCLVEFGKGKDAVSCVDVKSLCENTDAKACDDVNNQIHNEELYGDKFAGMGCARRYDNWTKLIWAGDNCVFGPKLMCPPGWNRVSYSAGPAVKNPGTDHAEGTCWKMEEGQKAPKKVSSLGHNAYILDNYQTAIHGANGICCEQDDRYQAIGRFFNIKIDYVVDSNLYNLKCEKEPCSSNSGQILKDTIVHGVKYFKGDSLGLNYAENDVCTPVINKQTGSTQNKTSVCLDHSIVKNCYQSTRGENNIFYQDIEECVSESAKKVKGIGRCESYLVPTTFCCNGEENCGAAPAGDGGGEEPEFVRGSGGGSVSGNPLLNKPTWDTVFQEGATKLMTPLGVAITAQEAESVLRGLAIVESGGVAKPPNSGQGYYGLMQINADEVQKYSQSPIQVVGVPANPDRDWIETNPEKSIQIATNYLVDMLNHQDEKLCPRHSNQYNRDCDYADNDNDKDYSQCLTVMQTGTVQDKLKYIYAAYNGGAGANCHNVTNFFSSNNKPPCFDKNKSICPLYAESKGSIWECDAGTGYEQTRGGALRMVDCFKQFNKDLKPDKLEDCCSAGQASCLTTCLAE